MIFLCSLWLDIFLPQRTQRFRKVHKNSVIARALARSNPENKKKAAQTEQP